MFAEMLWTYVEINIVIIKTISLAQNTIPCHPASPSVVEMELWIDLVQDTHLYT